MSENIRPEKVRSAAEYLCSNAKLYKECGIKYNTIWESDAKMLESGGHTIFHLK